MNHYKRTRTTSLFGYALVGTVASTGLFYPPEFSAMRYPNIRERDMKAIGVDLWKAIGLYEKESDEKANTAAA